MALKTEKGRKANSDLTIDIGLVKILSGLRFRRKKSGKSGLSGSPDDVDAGIGEDRVAEFADLQRERRVFKRFLETRVPLSIEDYKSLLTN